MSTTRPDGGSRRYTLAAFCITLVVLLASAFMVRQDKSVGPKHARTDRRPTILIVASRETGGSTAYKQFTDGLRRSTGAGVLQTTTIPHPTDSELVTRGRKLGAQLVVWFDRQTTPSHPRLVVDALILSMGSHPSLTQIQSIALRRRELGSGRVSVTVDDGPPGLDYAMCMTEGLWRYLRGDHRGSISLIDRALATHASKDETYALRYRALGQVCLHKYKEAVADLTKALTIHPDWAILYADRASAYSYIGNRHKAYDDSDKAVALCPKASALLYRMEVRWGNGDLAGALVDCNRALKLTAGLLPVLRDRGRIFADTKRYREAEQDFRRVLAADPDNQACHKDLAFIYSWERRYSDCIAEATKAIDLNPDSAYAYRIRAWCFHKTGDSNRAIADLDEAVRIRPDHIGARHSRAAILYDEGEYDRAAIDYEYVAEHDKSYPEAWCWLGSSYRRSKQYDKAISACTQRLMTDPKHVDALIDRGVAYAMKGTYRKALADLNQAASLAPKDDRAYTARSFVYFRSGDYARCVADCNEAIRLNPGNRVAYSRRGAAEFKMKHFGQSVSDIARAVRMRF